MNDALSAYVGRPVRLARTEREGDGADRGRLAGSHARLDRIARCLARCGGEAGPSTAAGFRMTIGIDGVDSHAEDGWIGRRVRVGAATVAVREPGRCAVTTLDPDRVSATRHAGHHRGVSRRRADERAASFGVWCEVVDPGRVAVGDPVEPAQP